MQELIKNIVKIRSKVETLRRNATIEDQTKASIITPVLGALGWDVTDPDEVTQQYRTPDGGKIDYALKIDGEVVLAVEAKPIDDPLTDIKWIGQVLRYLGLSGIEWCILTNGLQWKLYRGTESGKEKEIVEISLDPGDSGDITSEELAQKMWDFSRVKIRNGSLNHLRDHEKIRKALDKILQDPPSSLMKAVRSATGDKNLKPQKIKGIITQIWKERSMGKATVPDAQQLAPTPAKVRGKRKGKKPRGQYDESHHTAGKPREMVELYRSLDRLCFALAPGNVEKTFAKFWVNYNRENAGFCSVLIHKNQLRIFLKLKYSRIDNPPSFARDVSHLGHYGTGDLELAITSVSQLKEAEPLIRQSFEGQA